MTNFKRIFASFFVMIFLFFMVVPSTKAYATDFSSSVPYIYQLTTTSSGVGTKLAKSFVSAEYCDEPIILARGETIDIHLSSVLKNVSRMSGASFRLSSVDYIGYYGDDTVGAYHFFSPDFSDSTVSASNLRSPSYIYPASVWAPNFSSIKFSFRDIYSNLGMQDCINVHLNATASKIFAMTVADDAPGWDGIMLMWIYCRVDNLSSNFLCDSSYVNLSYFDNYQFYIKIPLVLEPVEVNSENPPPDSGSSQNEDPSTEEPDSDAPHGFNATVKFISAAAGLVILLLLGLWLISIFGKNTKQQKRRFKK